MPSAQTTEGYKVAPDSLRFIKENRQIEMDFNSTGKAGTYDPCRMGEEGELPHDYFMKWWQTSWLLPGEPYNKPAIIGICMECNWLSMGKRAYVATRLYLPYMLQKIERFEGPPSYTFNGEEMCTCEQTWRTGDTG